MKISYTANIRLPTEKAHGIQIMKMCEAFSELGNEVTLIVPWRFNSIKTDSFDYYLVKRNFKITRVPSFDLIILGRIGFWIQTITFLFFARIYLIFKKYDVLYTREQFTGLLFKNFILEILSLPEQISSVHTKNWNRADKLVVITSFIKNELIEKGIKPEKIFIAPDGVDFKKFDIDISRIAARKKLDLPLDKKIVVYTGHLFKWKGVDVLAEATGMLEDTLVLFVGGMERDVLKFSKRFVEKVNMKVLGHRPYSEIPYYLKAADVLVLPNTAKDNVSKFYTSPLKLFEYIMEVYNTIF